MTEGERERSVATHRVAEDTATILRDRERVFDPRRQLARHVRLHLVALAPRRLRRVEVEAGALAEVPARVIPRIAMFARARIARDERETELRSETERIALRREVLFVARQPGEPIDRRHRLSAERARRKEDREAHRLTARRAL